MWGQVEASEPRAGVGGRVEFRDAGRRLVRREGDGRACHPVRAVAQAQIRLGSGLLGCGQNSLDSFRGRKQRGPLSQVLRQRLQQSWLDRRLGLDRRLRSSRVRLLRLGRIRWRGEEGLRVIGGTATRRDQAESEDESPEQPAGATQWAAPADKSATGEASALSELRRLKMRMMQIHGQASKRPLKPMSTLFMNFISFQPHNILNRWPWGRERLGQGAGDWQLRGRGRSLVPLNVPSAPDPARLWPDDASGALDAVEAHVSLEAVMARAGGENFPVALRLLPRSVRATCRPHTETRA